MTHPSRHKRRKKWHSLYVWHRYIGLTAALFVLLLATTGLALNHYTSLGLDKRFVTNQWLLDTLEIRPPDTASSYQHQGHQTVLLEPLLWLDNRQLAGEYHSVTGLIRTDDMLILATPGELQLFSIQGELIDRLRSQDGLPNAIRRIGLSDQGRLVIETPLGRFKADRDMLKWQGWSGEAAWSTAVDIDPPRLQQLQQRWRNQALSWGKIILKLHTGRLFGNKGVLVMDGAAILLVFLSISGLWLWLRIMIRQRKHRKHRHHS